MDTARPAQSPTSLSATLLLEDAAAVARLVRASVVGISTHRGFASGVLWGDSGLIVTNAHAVRGARALVVLSDGRGFLAPLIARRDDLDLAALLPPEEVRGQMAPARIRSSAELRVGELVVAVGNPLGEFGAVALGVVAAAGGATVDERLGIRVAIELRPGNSGGALADAAGRVVGIPRLVFGPGLGQAVPSDMVDRFLRWSAGPAEPLGARDRRVL